MSQYSVIFGPPGCGKTHSLTEILRGFLNASPRGRFLFTSHTKAAAQTALGRIGENPRVDISTLHAFCFKELKLSRAQTVDDVKIAELFGEFGLDSDEGGDGKKYQEVMSHAACTGKSVMESYDWLGSPGTRAHFVSFESSYRAWKEDGGYLDFNDMLKRYLTCTRPSGHEALIIDEAQDMTLLHWIVVKHFMGLNPKCHVVVAGDDDQCLYSYAGADPHGMAQFREDYHAKETILSQSYRVPAVVHSVAEGVIGRVGQRVPKQYAPMDKPGSYQAFRDFEGQGLAGDTLILFNDKFIRREVEETLIEDAVPYLAVSGMPSPVQMRGPAAIRAAHAAAAPGRGAAPIRDIDTIRRGLNEKGADIYNSIGVDAVIERLVKGDHTIVNLGRMEWLVGDYYRRVDWSVTPTIKISTIHGAKGMEADNVHLLLGQSQAAVDYSFRDPDAQHRLFYVGVTRARRNLMTYEGENTYELPNV